MFKELDASQVRQPLSDFNPGPAPQQIWLRIEALVVDTSYQREIGKRGRKNIDHIAENFDWSKFAPVIVAPIEGGRYAIVDGQHRTTAAMVRDIEQVPCLIVQADRAKQAAAYRAVNGNITSATPQQLFYAALTAMEPASLELSELCKIAGVTICKRNQTYASMKTGETLAVRAMERCLATYGRDTLITSLQCVTYTADGNPGFLRPTVIEGLCSALDGSDWVEAGSALLEAMDDFSFPDIWGEITDGRDSIFPATARQLFSKKVIEHLSKRATSMSPVGDPRPCVSSMAPVSH